MIKKYYALKEKQKIVCKKCKKFFLTARNNQKTCSTECRKDIQAETYKRYSGYNEISSATVGAISELEVAMDLMKKGYAVFRALSPSCFCDLIAIKEKKQILIEARTGYIGNNNKPSFPTQLRGEPDCFGIYFPFIQKVKYYKLDKTEFKL